MKQLKNIAEVTAYQINKERKLYSANHNEILAGLTTDVYFIKTRQLLENSKYTNAQVTAEIFPRRAGVLAGIDEALGLLDDCNVQVEALPEGTKVNAKDVVMRISGKYTDFSIFETALLGILASSTGWATAADQVAQVVDGKPFFCFGARHVHPAVAPVMERAAIIGGASGASCILGAKLLNLEPVGTVPHALFLIVGDTLVGTKMYDEIMPPESPRTILVDTFKDEVEESLRLCAALGDRLEGVRVDTPSERGGVTPGLIKELRFKLDMAGHGHVQIFVSGGLDAQRVQLLSQAGADAFGVGSFISGAAPVDMTMDIKVVDGNPVAKRGRLPGLTKSNNLKRIF